jgi:hypothetical protein
MEKILTNEESAVSRSGAESVEPERYYAEVLSPSSGSEDLTAEAVQEAMNAGTRKSWKLVGVVNDPAGQGLILVWDQQGFISG